MGCHLMEMNEFGWETWKNNQKKTGLQQSRNLPLEMAQKVRNLKTEVDCAGNEEK